jgi:hypothetical protein
VRTRPGALRGAGQALARTNAPRVVGRCHGASLRRSAQHDRGILSSTKEVAAGMATHHLPHPHLPHPHVDEHPWRALPIGIALIVLLAAILIIASFAIAKAVTGRAY